MQTDRQTDRNKAWQLKASLPSRGGAAGVKSRDTCSHDTVCVNCLTISAFLSDVRDFSTPQITHRRIINGKLPLYLKHQVKVLLYSTLPDFRKSVAF